MQEHLLNSLFFGNQNTILKEIFSLTAIYVSKLILISCLNSFSSQVGENFQCLYSSKKMQTRVWTCLQRCE